MVRFELHAEPLTPDRQVDTDEDVVQTSYTDEEVAEIIAEDERR